MNSRGFIIATIILIAAVVLAFFAVKERRSVDEESKKLSEIILAQGETLCDIQGNYTAHFYEDSVLVGTNTAYIIKSKDTAGYEIHVLSEYSPEVYYLEISIDALAFCDRLGEGKVTYKPSTDLTMITLKKDNRTCEFVR